MRRQPSSAILGLGLFILLAACAKGVEDDGGETSGSGGSTSTDYKFRRGIQVTEGAPEGYSIYLDLNHAQLVTDLESVATGDDVRVFFKNAQGEVELDRLADPAAGWNLPVTRVWFRLQPDPDATGEYTLAYGRSDAANPPQNGANVFEFYDDFEDGTLDTSWTLSAIGGGTFDDALLDPSSPEYIEQSGYARVGGVGANIGDVSDSFVFLQRAMSGDFAVEAEILDVSGSHGAVAKMGGLMIRGSDAADAKNMMITIVNSPRERSSSARATDAALTTTTNAAVAEMFPQYVGMQRLGSAVSTRYTENGTTWIGLGMAATIDFSDPVLAGVPFSNGSGEDGYAHIGWIRFRKLVSPEPGATLAPEE